MHDVAEQYPIPSDRSRPEGLTEEVIGRWMAKEKGRRAKVVIATKITGGSNITREQIIRDCEGSLSRLGTDYIDVYQTHWPARCEMIGNMDNGVPWYELPAPCLS